MTKHVFWYHSMDLEIVEGFVCWACFLFCDCEGFCFAFQNAAPVINLIFSVFHKEHIRVYWDGIYTTQFFSPEIWLKTHKNTKH